MDYRTAFITGASSGIGRALASRLAAAGGEVAIAARREDKLRDVERAIVQAGGRPRVYVCDVADAESTRATLERADTEMGGLDLVIANAGVSMHRWSGKLTWQHCAPLVRVNVEGALATLLVVLPRMVER